ncbi:hypothetical protein D1872_241420 [compost metagenome]
MWNQSIIRNDIFIPIEALLPLALQGSIPLVVLVYIDKAVALLHLGGRIADQINDSPTRIAHKLYSVQDRFMHLFDVRAEISNPIFILYAAVLFNLVIGTDPVLHDEQGHLITIVQVAQR